jgi:LysR family hydrogen peroxide-inducible transcriptional activator
MDLGQLRYFNKIVEHRSFTKAAQDCSVSQPALSQQIGKLEKELGQPLFERQGRSIRLTPAGQLLQVHAEKILQLVEDAKRQITDDGQTGRICISAIPTIAPYLIPKILNAVGDQFPQANIVVCEDTTETLLKRCSDGDVDIGILALPSSGKYLKVEPLFDEELLLALPLGHPLVAKTRITSKDIVNEPFVLLGESHCLAGTIDSYCNEKNFRPTTVSRIEQLTTVQQLVGLGHGLSFVPKVATLDNVDGKVVYRSLTGDKPSRRIAVCWNPYRYQSQLLSNFHKALLEYCGTDFVNSKMEPLKRVPSKSASSKNKAPLK